MRISPPTLIAAAAGAAFAGGFALVVLFPEAAAMAQGWQGRLAPTEAAKPAAPTVARTKAQSAAKTTAEPPLHVQTQYLVRTTLLALNDANRTGNYTVLRDLAAPSFRERNSAADLAGIFAELRKARLDLSVAALMTAEIEALPALDAERRLRLKGSYPTAPNRVVFELAFEAVSGQWQLHGLSIATRPAAAGAGK